MAPSVVARRAAPPGRGTTAATRGNQYYYPGRILKKSKVVGPEIKTLLLYKSKVYPDCASGRRGDLHGGAATRRLDLQLQVPEIRLRLRLDGHRLARAHHELQPHAALQVRRLLLLAADAQPHGDAGRVVEPERPAAR